MTADKPMIVNDIDGAAAAWFSRVRSGLMTELDEVALEDWLEQDPAHRSAYDAVEQTWNGLELLRMHPRMLEMRDRLPTRPAQPLLRRLTPWAVAATIVATFGGVVGYDLWRGQATTAPATIIAGRLPNHVYGTGPNERTVITLADGSEVMLNGEARLRTISDPRRRVLRLERGQAFFRVAKDAEHPFVVEAGPRTITALGTSFDVSVDGERVAVTLVEGRVRVQTRLPAPPAGDRPAGLAAPTVEATEMVAGYRLAATDDSWSMARADVDQDTSWTRDQLLFEARPLAEVVTQMNERSPRKIVVVDESVAQTLVSGNFRPGDVDGFASALAAYQYASVSTRADGTIELSRP